MPVRARISFFKNLHTPSAALLDPTNQPNKPSLSFSQPEGRAGEGKRTKRKKGGEEFSRAEIRIAIPRQDQHVNRRADLLRLTQKTELHRAKALGLRLLRPRGAEHDDLGAELRGKLDGQVAQAADADDADALSGLEDVDQAVVDGRAGALQRRGVHRGQRVRDLVQVGFGADVIVGEGAGAEGGFAVDVAVGAVDVLAREAEAAFAARLFKRSCCVSIRGSLVLGSGGGVSRLRLRLRSRWKSRVQVKEENGPYIPMIPSTSAIPNLQLGDGTAHLLHDTNAFMPERHSRADIIRI